MKLTVLYRGPLSSCNFGCEYCPFGKWKQNDAELAEDRAGLERFVDWVESRPVSRVGVLHAVGRGLIRPWYQEALVRLTHMAHVERAAIQTNLSCTLEWVERCQTEKLGIWATFHPEWMKRRRFVSQCEQLSARGVRYSAGMVGFRRFADEAEALRRELSPDVYLWINAVKDGKEEHYTPEDVERFSRVDPSSPQQHPPSEPRQGVPHGESVISVDGEGSARRCHFVREFLGNIYEPGFEQVLRPRPCAKETCGCHIGYVHLDYLELDRVFGSGILERVPVEPSGKLSAAPRGSPTRRRRARPRRRLGSRSPKALASRTAWPWKYASYMRSIPRAGSHGPEPPRGNSHSRFQLAGGTAARKVSRSPRLPPRCRLVMGWRLCRMTGEGGLAPHHQHPAVEELVP
jgi:hypothetical protein